jgi:pimeloyl-ACP methyl ester carboxylesterase
LHRRRPPILWLRAAPVAVGVFLVLALVGPFLVPVPPLADTVPPERLADADSRFVEVDGLRVHYKTAGEGTPALLLLHGFGASVFSWREVMAPLAEIGTVVAFDRPAFGLTERPLPGQWQGESPYGPTAQADLTVGLMDALGIEEAVLVGNSAGGAVAIVTALRYPQRVEALVLVDAAVYAEGGTRGWLRPLLQTPQMRRLGPLLVRSIAVRGQSLIETAWHDPSRISPQVLDGYRRPLRVENWDRALWEYTLASRPLGLADRLGEVGVPVLVITGDDDRIVPTEQSVRLPRELRDARLAVIPDCGHVPQEECPELFLEAVVDFLSGEQSGR